MASLTRARRRLTRWTACWLALATLTGSGAAVAAYNPGAQAPLLGVAKGAVLSGGEGHGPAQLTFPSKLLGRETTSLVWLPEPHRPGKPLPVLYYLHDAVSGVSAREQADRIDFAAAATAGGFAVVAPDMGDETWCARCLWSDAILATGVPAESYVYDELIPAVESVVRVRAGRQFRAVVGSGMGGTGALIQGLRHPDRFGFVGGLSATLDLWDPAAPAEDTAALGSQGYLLSTPESQRRGINPAHLAVNALGIDLDIVVSHGDEIAARRIAQSVTSQWTQLGVDHTWVPFEGARSSSDAAVFASYYLGRLTASFRGDRIAPYEVSYHSAEPRFSAWGYDVTVTRPNVEVLRLLSARTDGRELMLSGTGLADVLTPARFTPGQDYRVIVTAESQSDDAPDPATGMPPYRSLERTVTAGPDGRIPVGAVAIGPTRPLDQREEPSATGQLIPSRVKIEIRDRTDGAATPATTGDALRAVHGDVAALPAPMNAWNVSLQRQQVEYANPTGSSQVLYLRFDSPTLHRRVGTQIYVPDAYLRSDTPFPVLYHLHGTGYGTQTFNVEFDRLLDRIGFLVVTPDVDVTDDAQPFCRNCYWQDAYEPRDATDTTPGFDEYAALDGNRPYDMDADTHLHTELIPLVEALFETRRDRAGRAVTGNSMGASGARIQAFRRPDVFSFAGSLSGYYDLADHTSPSSLVWLGYSVLQRYPSPATHEAPYRDFNPVDLAPHVVGQHVEVIGSIGDGCVTGAQWCGGDANSVGTEISTRRDNDRKAGFLDAVGLGHLITHYHGTHWWPDGAAFRQYLLEPLNRHFATAQPEPELFAYKTVDDSFAMWDYRVRVERPNREFLSMLGARRDARRFTLSGTGTARVVTPARFIPGASYEVFLTRDGQAQPSVSVTADASGRVALTLELGAARALDERRDLVSAGAFRAPNTRVEIRDVSAPGSDENPS